MLLIVINMFCGPHKGVLHNTMTNIWVYFFISKIFHIEIAEKPKKKHFSRESTSQASGTNIFISKTRLRHALCMRKQGKTVVMIGMPDASAGSAAVRA